MQEWNRGSRLSILYIFPWSNVWLWDDSDYKPLGHLWILGHCHVLPLRHHHPKDWRHHQSIRCRHTYCFHVELFQEKEWERRIWISLRGTSSHKQFWLLGKARDDRHRQRNIVLPVVSSRLSCFHLPSILRVFSFLILRYVCPYSFFLLPRGLPWQSLT
jgi:hypothetical protein